MDETGWSRANGAHERIAWARRQAGFETQEAAAAALGMKVGTYSHYERPPTASRNTGLRFDRAVQFSRRFKVSRDWLLTGEGSPYHRDLNPLAREIVDALEGHDEADQRRALAAVQLVLGRTGT